ncbi:MAG: hypothetical protein A3B68_00135 [Candidatus Melainabacteria bacterium RIFCSPHIGHO2_02_FULL_34_12]|nr:MAG: hypothetical protein A3B68_00135 [Candidatus Melainabacteria bacterium RIFCSPHIGHO2_02_FULL_34_12]
MTYINKFKTYCPMILFLFVVFSFSLNIQTANAQSKQKDTTIVSVNELTDLKGDEWAFKAVKELVEKYDVLEGYPDATYLGQKFATRLELAAALYDLATYFSDEIALDREDLAKLAKLMDEFSNELKAIQVKVDELEGKVADLDKRTGALETQVTEHKAILDEHEKRLAYAERRKGFILERLIKGVVVDIRDVTRGLLATILSPFDKKLSSTISK